MSTLFKSVLGAFAAVFATITAFAADATLPNGATEVAISTTAASMSHKGEMFAVKADESYSNQAPVYVAKIGDTPYATLEEAVDAAQNGDTVMVLEDVSDVIVEVAKNITISGSVTMNNVGINAVGATEMTVGGLTFTGNSWINCGTATKLTVSGVTANVTPSNTAYTNSRSAFISLGRSEQHSLELVVENCNIVSKGGSDPILGWAAIVKATITGSVFGSESAYQSNSDSIKFMGIADGAEFAIRNNKFYSNYNGIVFGQNVTRDNSYSVVLDGNEFFGGADHIWVEITAGEVCHATIKASSNNTVNGNPMVAGDIKAHTGVIKSWSSYAGVDIVVDAEGKVVGGTLAFYAADAIAEGYEVSADGAVAEIKVASIGTKYYASFASALAAAKDGDTITLLGDCELVSGIDIDKNITVDGAGYKVYAANNANDTEMFNIRSKVTITNLTFDANHKFSYGIQVQDAADVTLSDVSILYAGYNNWGAAVNLNGGKLFVSGNFTAFSGGENGGAFPFTGILYWGGDFKFADGVTASIADPTGATADSDLLLVGTVGLLSIEDADAFLSQFNIPSGFAPYTLALDADIVSSFGGFTGASPLPWNTIIDYGKQILEAIDESTTETQVTVGLLADTVIPDVFVYEDANFSINGNGKTLTGTIDVTDNVGTISNVVLTSDTTFVMTNVTTGCVKFGDNVTISSPVTIVPPANYGVGSAPLIEFTDGSGVKPEDFVIDQSAVEIPEGTEFVVEGNKIVLGTPVAKIGEVKYASLLGAIAAAKSGDTVTLLGDCGITTGIILNKNITIDGGNFTLTAESGDGSLAQMVRVDSAATIKNITLAVNHKYDYGIQMYNPASDLTLENVTILYAGKAEGHKNGELLFGASVFLQQGNLLVKGKFTAFSGGETAGTFQITGILYWPAGD
ncbi:MAG: hypothetical protein IJV91_01675, partial [Kiritimatiellae bacterium]|nr:hypothetical protein [Kiritimatiellia bacterium]